MKIKLVVTLLLFGAVVGFVSSMVFDYQTAERLLNSAFTAPTSFTSIQLIIDYTLPGMFFGIGLALIYLRTAFSMGRVAKSLLIIVTSTLRYVIAFWLVYLLILATFIAPIPLLISRPAGVAGALATFVLLYLLERIVVAPVSVKKKLLVSLLGGILGAILFEFFTYGRTLPYYVDPMTVSLIGNLIFFVGWQSIMMVAIGLPFVRQE